MKIRDIIREYAEVSDEEHEEFLEALTSFVSSGGGRDMWSRHEELFSLHMRTGAIRSPLFRGLSLIERGDLDAEFDFRRRNILKSRNLLSTSLNRRHVVEHFLAPHDGLEVLVLFEFVPSPQTRAILVDDHRAGIVGRFDGKIPNWEKAMLEYLDNEQEAIIDQGSEFKVLSKTRRNKPWPCGRKWRKHSKSEYWDVKLQQIR